MTSTSHSAAANNLSEERQIGTLGLTYRKSVMSLQSVFGWKSSNAQNTEQQSEREPLLNNNDEQTAQAGPSYGSVLDLPPARRVPKPKTVKSPVRVEAKVWFANEVSCISSTIGEAYLTMPFCREHGCHGFVCHFSSDRSL